MSAIVTNLVKNGDFATNTAGWAPLAVGDIATQVATPSHNGHNSLEVTTLGTANTGVRYGTVGTMSGLWYSGRVWIYAAGAAVGKKITLRLRNSTTGVQAVNDLTLKSGWQRNTVFYQAATTGAVYLDVFDSPGQGIFTFDITEVQVEAGYVPHQYVHTDGATATATVNDNVIWSGKDAVEAGDWFGGDPARDMNGAINVSYVASPVRRSGHAIRFHNEAIQTDAAPHTNRIHCDMNVQELWVREGDEYWVQMSLYLPTASGPDPGYVYVGNEGVSGGTWSTFADLPHPPTTIAGNGTTLRLDCSTTPPSIQLSCYGGDDSTFNNNDPANASHETFNLCSLVHDTWIDFLFHIKWVSTGTLGSSTGFVEVWINQAYWPYGSKRYRPMLFASNPVGIIHAAHYHSQSAAGQLAPYASTTYQDEWVIGKVRASAFLPKPMRLYNKTPNMLVMNPA